MKSLFHIVVVYMKWNNIFHQNGLAYYKALGEKQILKLERHFIIFGHRKVIE
jgi:hypothetical protein